MDYKYIIYEKLGKIAKITINRPKVMNALSRETHEEINSAFIQADSDEEVRVIVLAASGDNFGAGHDIGSKERFDEEKTRPRDYSPMGMFEFSHSLLRMKNYQRNISKPTIAMVQGYCIMGSWMLASACDLIIVSKDAKISDRAVRIGGSHVQYSTLFWDLGPRKAKEYLWTGDFIDGAEAYRLGMVNKVVPREHLEEETLKLANKIAINDPIPLRLSKMSINQAMDIMGYSTAINASFPVSALTGSLNPEKHDKYFTGDQLNSRKQRNKEYD